MCTVTGKQFHTFARCIFRIVPLPFRNCFCKYYFCAGVGKKKEKKEKFSPKTEYPPGRGWCICSSNDNSSRSRINKWNIDGQLYRIVHRNVQINLLMNLVHQRGKCLLRWTIGLIYIHPMMEIFFFFFRLMIFRKSISLWKTRWIVFFLERNLSCFVQFIYTKTLFNFVKSKLLETFVQTYIFFSTIIEMEVKHRSVSIYVMSVSYIFVRK